MTSPSLDRIDLDIDSIPDRWYNVLPDLPRLPDDYLDPETGEVCSDEYLHEILPPVVVAQERSLERWVPIPTEVRDAYKLWRPTPLFRARALERHLDTPAEIYFKYEGSSPTGSFKLNSALAQAYYARSAGYSRLCTDTGAGQWGSALAMAGAVMGIDVRVWMVRASFHQKPYRRYLMETYGAKVTPSPGETTEFGRDLLEREPEHPGSEATAVSEALEVVRSDPKARYALGAFANFVLTHQTVIGLEAREQLESIDREPDYLVASIGCGSNLGGFTLPWVPDKLAGQEVEIVAAEPAACPTLTEGEYRYDIADATGSGPMVRTYTLGHEFVPPPIHSGGLRYHGAAPIAGLMHHEEMLRAIAYRQDSVFEAGQLFARLTGLVPAPETAHAIRATIDVANECRERGERKVIAFCYSGHGLLDLAAYDRYAAGAMSGDDEREPAELLVGATAGGAS